VPTHPELHLIWTIGFLVATGGAMAGVRNRVIKRRLLFAEVLFLASMVVHAAILEYPAIASKGAGAEYFIIVFGAITVVVTLLLNPWFRERPGENVPAIVQDTVIVALVGIASLFVFESSSFIVGITGSAIVIGLALQDTLGNAFAGLAIQIERPFKVGHWITAAGFEGRAVEVTWRATKIRTKAGNLVVLPNSVVAQQPINNYSEPHAPTRLLVEVGIAYGTPPNEARDAILIALRRADRVLADPPPHVFMLSFGSSAIIYQAQFWIDDYEFEEDARSDVHVAIYYELRRRQIEIPFPIQVEYSREDPPAEAPDTRARYRRAIAAVPVFAALPENVQQALADSASERLYGDREVIVREGEAGGSMFLVRKGRVVITVGPDHKLVAVTEADGYFGEMSLLTGDPRTATVTASGDCVVLEIAAADFRTYVQVHPEVIDLLAATAALRRQALEDARATSSASTQAERQSLVKRMRKFFGLD
jgi:small-conductance mechanosensitive channel